MKDPLVPKYHNNILFKDLGLIHLDFEYNRARESRFNLVCVSMRGAVTKDIWLHKNDIAKQKLKNELKELRGTHLFSAFNAVAEASCFISLGLDPTKFAWIDLQIEYKMLLNHWHKYQYGDQLIKGKKKKTSPPRPKWEMTERQRMEASNNKPESSLIACTYKLLGKTRDSEHKDKMRDLIISCPDEFNTEEKRDILEYCAEDTEDMPKIWEEIKRSYQKSAAKRHISYGEIALRGKAAARAALMTQLGYPVNRRAVVKFSKSVNKILNEIAESVNEQFPNMEPFRWNKRENRYSKIEKVQRNWIETCEHADRWMMTDGGKKGVPKFSLSLEAYCKHYTYRHDYPDKVFPAQMIRYLKTKQNLNGFIVSKNKKNFFDYYGGDGRARAWLNPYGSQSSRFQPGATGFIPLKASWMRSLIQPPPGSYVCGIDYGSEEFLLSAILSKDEKMYEAYVSGDPYFHFAKLAEAVPMGAERKDYEDVRIKFKATVLGITYLMTAPNLAIKLTNDTGEIHTQADAQKQIDTFFNVFSKYGAWIEQTIYEYRKRGFLKLADGWIMFGDNPNHRSISNCPIQGMGGCILRKAIEVAQERGLNVIIPLHDALYIEYKAADTLAPDILFDSMKEGFRYWFKDDDRQYEMASSIRMDIDIWGPYATSGKDVTKEGRRCKRQEIYIDERSKKEYELFKKYL